MHASDTNTFAACHVPFFLFASPSLLSYLVVFPSLRFKAAGVSNTYQLIGKFLTLKHNSESQTGQELCGLMFAYLKEVGINSYRSGIVTCLAEKLDTMIPGFCDME